MLKKKTGDTPSVSLTLVFKFSAVPAILLVVVLRLFLLSSRCLWLETAEHLSASADKCWPKKQKIIQMESIQVKRIPSWELLKRELYYGFIILWWCDSQTNLQSGNVH